MDFTSKKKRKRKKRTSHIKRKRLFFDRSDRIKRKRLDVASVCEIINLYILCIILNYKKLKFKQFINGITIDH